MNEHSNKGNGEVLFYWKQDGSLQVFWIIVQNGVAQSILCFFVSWASVRRGFMGSVTLVFGQFAVHTGWDEWSSCAVGTIVRFVIFSTVRTDRGLFCRAIVGIVVVFLTDVTPLYVKVIIHFTTIPKASTHTVSTVFKKFADVVTNTDISLEQIILILLASWPRTLKIPPLLT